MKKQRYVLPIIIAVIVVILSLGTLLKPRQSFSVIENRALQHRVHMSKENILSAKAMEDWEQLVADQFLGRNQWVELQVSFDELIGQKISEGVYRGEDGYLIQHFSMPDTEAFQEDMATLRTFAEEHENWNNYFMLIPTAAYIMEEKLPQYAPVHDESRLLQNVVGELDGYYIQVPIFELLKGGKDQGQVYFKTDHHWTAKGAFMAASSFLSQNNMTPSSLEDFQHMESDELFYGSLYSQSGYYDNEGDEFIYYVPKSLESEVVKVDYHGDVESEDIFHDEKLREKDKYAVYFGGNYAVVDIINPEAMYDRTLVIFKDSFGNAMVPYLVPYYQNIRMIDLRYIRGGVEEYIPQTSGDMLFAYNAVDFDSIRFDKLK